MFRLTEVALTTVVALIVGYLLGGWVYETAGNSVWAQPANFIYNYQTLIGVLLASAVTLTAAAIAWRASERMISQARKHSQHQMAVTTAREGAIVRRTVREPLYEIGFVRGAIERVRRPLEARQFEIAAKYVSSFEAHNNSIRVWITSDRTKAVTDLLEPQELDALNAFSKQLRRVADFLRAPDSRVLGDLQELVRRTDRAEDAIAALLRRANGWVPD